MLLRPPPRPIERRAAVDLPPEAFHRDYVMANRPVVVSDPVPEWTALRTWTPSFLKTRYGTKQVQVSIEARMALGEFIDRVLASTNEHPAPYMYRLYLGTELPELAADVRPANPYSPPSRLASAFMPQAWRRPDGYFKLLIGGVGSEFPILHFDADNHHACVTQIYGDKRFVLFPPHDSPYVYPDPQHENRSTIPSRQVFEPDDQRYPHLARATRYEVVLHPGEMLFVPCRWWHVTRALSTSIAVCQNVLDRSNWKGFVRWSTLPRASVLSRVCKRARFATADLLMSHVEGL